MVNGEQKDLPPNPHKIVLPPTGTLHLNFVDLRPVDIPEPPPLQLFRPAAPAQATASAASEEQDQESKKLGLRVFTPHATAAAACTLEPPTAVADASSPGQPGAAEQAAAHTQGEVPLPKQPVLLDKPVLMVQAQTDALIAALQHWPALDPVKVSEGRSS